MSETLKEMLVAWEKSRAEPTSNPLPERFYDVRKRPTHRRHVRKAENLAREGMTEQLEARRRNLTD